MKFYRAILMATLLFSFIGINSINYAQVITENSLPKGIPLRTEKRVALYPNISLEDIAGEMGYYELAQQLRTESVGLLDKIQSLGTAHQNTYIQAGRLYQGLEFNEDFSALYAEAQGSFNQAFERADRAIIFRGEKLDEMFRSFPDKKVFVEHVKQQLKQDISKIISQINIKINKIKTINS